MKAAVVAFAFLACASPYYGWYVERHPDWDPATFPRKGADVHEVLAGAYAPPPEGQQVSPAGLHVFDITEETWPKFSRSTVRGHEFESSPDRSFLVVSFAMCRKHHFPTLTRRWYLVMQGELWGWSHATFTEDCRRVTRAEFPEGLPEAYTDCLMEFLGAMPFNPDWESNTCGPAPDPRLRQAGSFRPGVG